MKTETKKASLSLKDWIDEVTTLEVARLLKVHRSAVYHWRRGFVVPRTNQLLAIQKYSRGRVQMEAVIKHFHSAANKNKSSLTKKKAG